MAAFAALHGSLQKPAPREINRAQRKRDRETEYRKASKFARIRDKGHCRICGASSPLETHHLVPRSLVGSKERNRTSNLVTLCSLHHQEVTRHVIKLEPLSTDGADGMLRVLRHMNDQRGYVLAMEAA